MTSTAALQPETSAQPRYEILDGLRGVAAVLVILYHFGEGFATSAVDQMMNHGYLAVDFFLYCQDSSSGMPTTGVGKTKE